MPLSRAKIAGPSGRKRCDENSVGLLNALQQAQTSIDYANANISNMPLAALGTCEQLRFDARMLDEADDDVIS